MTRMVHAVTNEIGTSDYVIVYGVEELRFVDTSKELGYVMSWSGLLSPPAFTLDITLATNEPINFTVNFGFEINKLAIECLLDESPLLFIYANAPAKEEYAIGDLTSVYNEHGGILITEYPPELIEFIKGMKDILKLVK